MDEGTTNNNIPDTNASSSGSRSGSGSGSGSSFPLWAIIVIVVAGTAVVVGGLVYGCTYLHRWRWARRHRRTVFVDGREVSVYHASSVASSSRRGRRSRDSNGSSIDGGRRDTNQSSSGLWFDDVDFWRGGGGWGSSVGGNGGGYNDDEEEDEDEMERYYESGMESSTTGGGGSRRGRKLRKKKRRTPIAGGSTSSRGGFFSGGGGGGTSSIMSDPSVGDIAMVEAGIVRRETLSSSTKERFGSRRSRRSRRRRRRTEDRNEDDESSSHEDNNSSNGNSNNNNSSNSNGGGSRRGRHKRKKTLSLPPTLPEVWRLSSGLLSVVSFASLNNLYNNLSNNHTTTNTSNRPDGDDDDDGSKEMQVVTESTMRVGGGGGSQHSRHQRPSHVRRTSNAWVDEDAIHGPAVHVTGSDGGKGKGLFGPWLGWGDKKGKGSSTGGMLSSPVGSGRRKGITSWRRSFRESWPLRTMISPTLPKLSSPWGSPFGSPLFGSPKPNSAAGGAGGGGGYLSESSTMRSASGTGTLDSFSRYYNHHGHGYHHENDIAGFRFPNQPTLAPPTYHGGDDGRSDAMNHSPPRQLPKPPRQALLAASVESAGDSPLWDGYYRGSNWTTGARTMSIQQTPSRSGSGASRSERGLLSSYYTYEDMDNSNSNNNSNTAAVLTNPYHHPVAGGAGSSSAGGSGSGGGGSGAPLGLALTTPRDSVVPAPLRLSSADSTLSGILRDTEKRLQDGTVTGVVARRTQRVSISPSKRTLGTSASGTMRPGSAASGGGGNEHIATLMITSTGGVHHAPPPPSPALPSPAPSPTRGAPHRVSGHVRGDSQASMLSEADSLFAEPSPVLDHFHALSSPAKSGGGFGVSPSGPPPQQPVPPLPLARHNSFNGSLSSSGSSLPTIYSVDENADGDGDDTRITAFGSSTQDGLNKLAGFVTSKSSSNTLDDPFVVIGAAATTTTATRTTPSPTRSAVSSDQRQQRRSFGARQPSSGRSIPDFSQGPRLYGGPNSRSEASLWSTDSPLGAISGNSSRATIDTRTRRNEPLTRSESRIPRAQTPGAQTTRPQTARAQTPQSGGNMILLAAPTSAVSTADGERHHDKRNKSRPNGKGDSHEEQNYLVHSSTIPNIFLTTPSEKTDDSPLPRHLEELRGQASSPTLGRGREQTPEAVPPSPAFSKALSSVYDYYMDMPSMSDPQALSPHRRAAGEVRKMSQASSPAYSTDPRDFEREKRKALDELNRMIRSDHVEGRNGRPVSTPAMGPSAGTVRMVPPEWLSNHMAVNRGPSQSHGQGHRQPQHPMQRQGQVQRPEQLHLHPDRRQNQKQQSQIPVSTTVAQLRRMNSQVSSYSNAASGYSDGSSAGPFLPALIEGNSPIVSPPRSRRDSARNYLALGSPPKNGPGSARSEGRERGDRSQRNSGTSDKENDAKEASSSSSLSAGPVSHGSRIPRLDVKMDKEPMVLEDIVPETPKKSLKRLSRLGNRASEDSLGLYDMDGFFISSSPETERKSGFRM